MNSRKAPEEQNNLFDNIPNEILFKYIESSVNLEVVREMAVQNMKNLQQKRAELMIEKKKLNDLHHRVFSMNNDMCDSVWKFSNKYDFPGIIEDHIIGRMTIRQTQPVSRRDEYTRLENEFQELSREIANVMADLKRLSDGNHRVNMKQESTIDVQSSTLKSETQEVSNVHNNTPLPKFVLKTPTAFSGAYRKR